MSIEIKIVGNDPQTVGRIALQIAEGFGAAPRTSITDMSVTEITQYLHSILPHMTVQIAAKDLDNVPKGADEESGQEETPPPPSRPKKKRSRKKAASSAKIPTDDSPPEAPPAAVSTDAAIADTGPHADIGDMNAEELISAIKREWFEVHSHSDEGEKLTSAVLDQYGVERFSDLPVDDLGTVLIMARNAMEQLQGG